MGEFLDRVARFCRQDVHVDWRSGAEKSHVAGRAAHHVKANPDVVFSQARLLKERSEHARRAK